jgi:two-component system CAI-1 autoinducer sensor kinase/phosphatase CqsS
MRLALPAVAVPLQRTRNTVTQWLLRHERDYDHDTLRMVLLGWIGIIGLPMYYAVWTWVFPQNYDSAALRAIGFALCVPLALWLHRMPGPYGRVYAFFTVTYSLPFLFCFMYLMNHGSPVWSQSMLVALILLYHFDIGWATVSLTLGSALAVGLFILVGDRAFLVHQSLLEQLPIAAFTILVVSVAKLGRRVMAQEKLAGMAHGLATVSHELRTPLLSVDANVRGANRLLTRDGAHADLAVLGEALSRIQFEVRHMNHMVDLFLMSATAVQRKLEPTEHLSMRELVENSVQRYPFSSQAQRESVSVKVRADFTFAGQRELAVVVVLNLLRNALKALQRAGKGQVRLVVDGQRPNPRLLVIDSGCGIARRDLPKIFKRFYTSGNGGAGIGLTLCRDILDAWQARIRCVSRELAYTMFVLEFPAQAELAALLPGKAD